MINYGSMADKNYLIIFTEFKSKAQPIEPSALLRGYKKILSAQNKKPGQATRLTQPEGKLNN
jgi:hypothetical protein